MMFNGFYYLFAVSGGAKWNTFYATSILKDA